MAVNGFLKWNSDNCTDYFKAHLMAQGFSQEGIDFEKKILSSYAIQYSFTFTSSYSGSWTSPNWCYHCLFEWGSRQRHLLERYIDFHHLTFECRLCKIIYGLKQAAHLCNITFDSFFSSNWDLNRYMLMVMFLITRMITKDLSLGFMWMMCSSFQIMLTLFVK